MILLIATALVVGLTAAVAAFTGGYYWSISNAFGTFVAGLLTFGYPILLTAIAMLILRGMEWPTKTIYAISFGLCIILTTPMIVVGVVLACGLAGDCL